MQHNHTPLLEGRHLDIGYRNGKQCRTIQSSLNFTLQRGKLACLLGPNGIGKSTLLRTLSAAQPALKGQLLLEGNPLHSYTLRERSRKIGIVLTDRTRTGGLTVRETASLGRYPYTGFFGKLTPADRDAVEQALQATGIAHKASEYMSTLSDGERQKVMIAKALAQECPLILLDEPTAFLDVVSRLEILALLHRIAADSDKAILLSTHEVEQSLMLADCLWLLSPDGLACGATEDLVLDGSLQRLFPSHRVCFDSLSGTYLPQSPSHGPAAVVEAASPLLGHWARNALARQGYRCLPATCTAPNILRIASPACLTWQTEGKQATFASFGEWQEALRHERNPG